MEERQKQKKLQTQKDEEEKQAIHRGRLKYLEKSAAQGKTEQKSSGLGGFFGDGVKDLLQGAATATTSGQSMFAPMGGGGRSRSSGGGGGWNPITGETYTNTPRRKPKRKTKRRRY